MKTLFYESISERKSNNGILLKNVLFNQQLKRENVTLLLLFFI